MKIADLWQRLRGRRPRRAAPLGLTPEEKKLIEWALWVARHEYNLGAKTRHEITMLERKLRK